MMTKIVSSLGPIKSTKKKMVIMPEVPLALLYSLAEFMGEPLCYRGEDFGRIGVEEA